MISSDTRNGSIRSSKHSGSTNNSSRTADQHDEKKVKDLNREIMMIFGMYKASFGHASAALLSVLSYLSENYINQHPESKKILLEYFEKEFDMLLNKVKQL